MPRYDVDVTVNMKYSFAVDATSTEEAQSHAMNLIGQDASTPEESNIVVNVVKGVN